MKIFTIMWSSYLPLLKEAAGRLGIELAAFSTKQMNLQEEAVGDAIRQMGGADLILLYRTNDAFWEEMEEDLALVKGRIPLVVVGSDPSLWAASTVHPEIVAETYRYLLFNGIENIVNMLRFLQHRLFHAPVAFEGPCEVPWQGIWHPDQRKLFPSRQEYWDEYRRELPFTPAATVGLLYSRSNWATGNLEVERAFCAALERRGIAVVPVFFYSLKDEGLGNLSGVECIERFLMEAGRPAVDGIVKLTAFFLGTSRGGMEAADASAGAELLARLGVPLFGPVISYYRNEEEWYSDPAGLGSQVAWSVAMPEFEGVIEPLVVGATTGIATAEGESYAPIAERIDRLAERIGRWTALAKKPAGEKKVAFILHNNPCASLEATVGAGAHLDTLESVARILAAMEQSGYAVAPPSSGKALIDEITARKAIAEFRWTTVEQIVECGGALALVERERYEEWFRGLPAPTRRRMSEAWGEPPGEERDGIPAAMVHDGRIVVTGVRYGNVVVCVQPKRGCAGARCDGQVCKILHDPDVPPPHQYIATYLWLSREFGADAVVHVGTHGNLEFLPGKGTGLSAGCFPHIAIDGMPHLYIYNADNPPEGTIAKRRSNAVLVDHLQTVMVKGELYGDLEQVERLLDEYERYRDAEPAKAHTISHLIMEKVRGLNLLEEGDDGHDNFPGRVREIHDRLAVLRNTHIPTGMHVFGKLPAGEALAAFLYAIVRFEKTPESLRGIVAALAERGAGAEPWRGERRRPDTAGGAAEAGAALTAPGVTDNAAGEENAATADELDERIDAAAEGACREYVLRGVSLAATLREEFPVTPDDEALLRNVEGEIREVHRNILASDETAALFAGLDGKYIPPGPSGLITRGRRDVLPTGRNFYSLDPQRVPTPAAWEIGKLLAERTLGKYLAEEGRYPENIAFHWQCTDIMWADGEGMAQMLYLIGARPLWQGNGRVKSFAVIPLPELGRPRIDITVRVSGITRDNFPGAIALLDEAVQEIAGRNESPEENFVRKHTQEKLEGTGADDASPDELRKATYRIFASMPGTYQAGTQLAVYASAWKTEQDLADVFLSWNGYAYGKGTYGEAAHGSLRESLATVALSFNKTVTDEYDLTGCCCYFGTHGGMINAAQVVSGQKIRNYYGDTRETDRVAVRTLTEEIRRVARAKILNPRWIEGMKEHGYKGAADISKRVGRLYGWQATAKAVDGAVFDDCARTFMMDEENRAFFAQNNPWALEEMARRLIEAAERGLWNPAPDVREALKDVYVEIEGWIEERMGDVKDEFQGGSIDIVTADAVAAWKKRLEETLG